MIRQERLLLDKIISTNHLHGLFREGDSVLLALSGGLDSTVLAHLFAALRRRYGLRLYIAHIHHGLSAQAASFERSACRTAHELSIPCFVFRSAVRKYAVQHGIGIEEAGRVARYDFFKKIALQKKIRLVATAHTRDDQAETVLFRIIRGTSLSGLSGIPYRRQEGKIVLIRPLLDCLKSDLLMFARTRKISYVDDRSNETGPYTRNRLRRRLIPQILKSYNPRFRDALIALQSSCLEVQPVLQEAADRAWKACRPRRVAGGLSLSRAAFLGLQPFLRQALFFRLADELKIGRKRLRRIHADKTRQLAGKAGVLADFPGFRAISSKGRVLFVPARPR